MATLRVLEFVRSLDAVWNLPAGRWSALARDFPEVRFDSPADQAAADELIGSADVVYGWAVTPTNFDRAERLRWIHVSAASVTSLLFPALVESDVAVTNGRGLHAVSMAEHTLGVMLAFARKLHLARDAQNGHRWEQRGLWTESPPIGELQGTTLGLLGLGAIGTAIAVRARSLGVRVLALRRHPASDPAPADEQWGLERLDDLVSRADWLVLAAPLTAGTRGMMSAARLARMKPTAVLINLGRGGLVDESALIAALQQGRIAGAGLDVFAEEPLPPSSPLWDLPQVIATPHISGLGPAYWERATDQFARNLRAFLDDRPLENVVDKRAGY